MPKNEQGQVKCINNSNHEMFENPGTVAVIEVKKNVNGEIDVNPTQFVPMKLFVCKQCGYVENYFSPMN